MASEQVGVLTRSEGDVIIFALTHDQAELPKDAQGDLALFEKKLYRVHKAKIGDSLYNGTVIRTAPAGKARIVYNNGDQLTLGPGSSFRIQWNQDTADARIAQPLVEMLNGSLRGVISPSGPRRKFKVKTHAATMGVRGTDFFVVEDTAEKVSEFSVLRGEVAVQPNNSKTEIKVQTANSVDIHTMDEKKEPVAQKINRGQLEQIRESSQVAALPKAEPKIVSLETQADHATLEEIKTYTPKLYAQLSQSESPPPSDRINNEVIEELRAAAPEGKAKLLHGADPLDFEKKAYEKIDQSK